MTIPNAIVDAMNEAHSHGADIEKAHPLRADRPTSFSLDDIAVPYGREEDWQFTPMRRIERLFEPANYGADDASVTADAPASVVVETVTRDDERLGAVFIPGDRTAVVAWNGFEQATVVEIPAEAEPGAPVHVNAADIEDTHAQRIVIRAEKLSKVTVILPHIGSAQAALSQTVEVETGDSADLTVVSLQEWDNTVLHTPSRRLAPGRDSKPTHIVTSFGDDFIRTCTDTDPRGPGARLNMLDVYFVDGGQHPEHRVFADHFQPKCFLRVTYKGALQGENAHSVWIGGCFVCGAADGTNTYELNRNPVLIGSTKVDSVPDLETGNGEIKDAGYASATGRFDDEQLSYLTNRSIPEHEARRLVVHGFFTELINQIGVSEVVEHPVATVKAEPAKSRSN